MAGARVREAIRVYVEVDGVSLKVTVGYLRTIIMEVGNLTQRTDVTTTTVVSPTSFAEYRMHPDSYCPDLDEKRLVITHTGRRGNTPLVTRTQYLPRSKAGGDLRVFDQYVKKVLAYRESPEYAADRHHDPLPVKQGEELNKDLSTAAAAGTVPFTIGGGIGAAVGKKLIPRTMVRSRAFIRFLSSRMGKILSPEQVASKMEKLIGTTGLTKSVDARQAGLGADYLDPTKQRLYVYTDFKEGGQSIYSHDVSPAWVKEAHHWLYKVVFGSIEFLLKAI